MSKTSPDYKKKASSKITIAVLSDLHACDNVDDESEPSYLKMSIPLGDKLANPIASLLYLIKNRSLSADIVLCAGDLGDKAKSIAIQYSWTHLQTIKKSLNAGILIATPGNHDHDSRSKYCEYDPRGTLQSLAPEFPFQDEILNDKFWARNYAVIVNHNYRIVVFNSSAFHGINTEFQHGRISPRTLEKLKDELRSKGNGALINIFICHHHPHKIEDIKLTDYEAMIGGQSLLEFLGSGEVGNWLFVHGHKHFPKICYAAGTSIAPIVFSVGSFSAVLERSIATTVKNQFYILELDIEHIKKYGLVGKFETWDWELGYGWRSADTHSGLPSQGGFGYRTNLNILAQKIAEHIGDKFLKWEEVLQLVPELQYLIPADLKILIGQLRSISLDIRKILV